MKHLTVGLILCGLLTACTKPVTDPIGEPWKISLEPPAQQSGKTGLKALVDYSGFGGVPATVEFRSGTTVLATVSERQTLQPTAENPWDFAYSAQVSLESGQSYSLTARIIWKSPTDNTSKTLDSSAVTYNTP